MLSDTFGWVKRNLRNMDHKEQRKLLSEVNQIKSMLERNLNTNTKGVI
jgi:hypothetical protein